MTRGELEKCLIHNVQVEYEGKHYKLRAVYTMNIRDITRTKVEHYDARDLFLIDMAELFDKKSNYLFSVFAADVKVDAVTAELLG